MIALLTKQLYTEHPRAPHQLAFRHSNETLPLNEMMEIRTLQPISPN